VPRLIYLISLNDNFQIACHVRQSQTQSHRVTESQLRSCSKLCEEFSDAKCKCIWKRSDI